MVRPLGSSVADSENWRVETLSSPGTQHLYERPDSATTSRDHEMIEDGTPNELGRSQAHIQTTDTHMEPDPKTILVPKEFRLLPIIPCIFVPFSILLAIPGLTEPWYIRTDDQHNIIEYEKNPLLLNIANGISLGCAILANICLLVRLSEKKVKRMTFACILLFSFHDIVDIAIIVFFIVKTQKDDGFILGQAFWMTVCSTISSLVTNSTLIVDYIGPRDLDKAGSGLTAKQRSLTIIVIILLCYLAIGAAVNTALMSLTFVDALYFSIVCIETIGFGDINPQTPRARVFSTMYTALGIIIITMAIGLIRESLLEAIQIGLHTQIGKERARRIRERWIGALQWRLQQLGLPVWVYATEDSEGVRRESKERVENQLWTRLSQEENGREGLDMDTKGKNARFLRLNVQALNDEQLRAAAMEAGAPLDELLHDHLFPVRHEDSKLGWREGQKRKTEDTTGERIPISPTHHRLGKMIMLLGSFAVAVGVGSKLTDISEHGNGSKRRKWGNDLENGNDGRETVGTAQTQRPRTLEPQFQGHKMESNNLTQLEVEHLEMRMFNVRLAVALVLFFTFWLAGAAIFTVTEDWTFGLALYFCFITFTTVGYVQSWSYLLYLPFARLGDPVPRTPAGRSFFVGWALLGVGTMTILISILVDRYSERYKTMITSAESETTASSPPPASALSSSGVPHKPCPLSGTEIGSGSELRSNASSGRRVLRQMGITCSSNPAKEPSALPSSIPIRSRPFPFPEYLESSKKTEILTNEAILNYIDSLRALALSVDNETNDENKERRFTRVEDELKTLLGLIEHRRRRITM